MNTPDPTDTDLGIISPIPPEVAAEIAAALDRPDRELPHLADLVRRTRTFDTPAPVADERFETVRTLSDNEPVDGPLP